MSGTKHGESKTVNNMLTLYITTCKFQKFCAVGYLYGSQNKQPLFPYTALTDWFL